MRGITPDGHRVHAARLALGLTQEELAVHADVDVKTIRKAEQGKRLDASTLAALAQALGVELRQLLTGDAGMSAIEAARHRIVEQWVAAWVMRDMDALMALHAEDGVLHLPGDGEIPFGGRHVGKAAMRRATEQAWQMVQTTPAFSKDYYTLVTRGDTVIFLLHGAKAVGVDTGAQVQMSAAHIYRFQGELIVDLHVEYDTAALRRVLST